MLNSAVITRPRRNIFGILDIGTTKTVCLIVRMSNSNIPQIIGIGYKASTGINGGVITNVKQASHSIISTLDAAEQVANETIDQVYVNISACNIASSNIISEISSMNHEISERDIKRIMLQSCEKCNENEIIIHNIPIKYTLDGNDNITCVKGLYGNKLSADMHVVTCSKSALLNIENCITSCSINMFGCIAEPYASGLSCLSKEEKELGATIIDIGGGFTSIGTFKQNKFIYADYISVGSIHITQDIAYGLCLGLEDAERIKIIHGDSYQISNDKPNIEFGEDDNKIQISHSDLIGIIRPRVEEIFEMVKGKIQDKNLIKRVVITGGGSQLPNIQDVASYVLNKQVRTGLPQNIHGMPKEHIGNPIFSGVIGSAILIHQTFYSDYPKIGSNNEGTIKKIVRLLGWNKSKI